MSRPSRRLHESVAVLLIVPWIRRQDLISFQATCKIFRDAALPLLYADVRLAASVDNSSDGARSLHLLVRSLLENSELAQFVRNIDIHYEEEGQHLPGCSCSSRRSRRMPAISARSASDEREESRPLLEKAIRAAKVPFEEAWIKALHEDDNSSHVTDVLIPLLLWSTQQGLRRLSLAYSFHARSRILRLMMEHIMGSKTPASDSEQGQERDADAAAAGEGRFPRLEEVVYAASPVGHEQETAVGGFGHILSLFRLPSIKTITLTMDDRPLPLPPAEEMLTLATPVPRENENTNPPSRGSITVSPSLHSLTCRSEAGIATLAQLVAMAPHLTHLEYGWWCNLDIDYAQGSLFDAEKLTRALAPTAKTLRSLTVGIDYYWSTFDAGINPGWYGIVGKLHDMRAFISLERLQVPLLLLLGLHPSTDSSSFGFPPLPASLQELRLTADVLELQSHSFDGSALVAAVRSFFSSSLQEDGDDGAWRTRMPNLKKLAFDLRGDGDDDALFLGEDDYNYVRTPETRAQILEICSREEGLEVLTWEQDKIK